MGIVQTDIFERSLVAVKKICNLIESWIEHTNSNKRLKYFSWILAVLVPFSVLLLLNVLTPMIADDFCYLFVYGDFDTKIGSVGDIVQSQINHYYMWGGRSVVHFIAQSLLLLPPFLIDILNSLVYLLYTFLIYLHIKGRNENSISLFILINLTMWFIQPVFGDTILWITGSANYLWGTTIILLFLLPYRLYEGKKSTLIFQIFASLSLFIFGIIAGWTNENTAGAMLVIAVLFLIYYRSQHWNIPTWALIGLVGAILGYGIMIIAPGNQLRAEDAGATTLFLVCYRFVMHTIAFVSNCGVLNLFFVIFLILFFRFRRNLDLDVLKLSFIFFVGALAAIYSMVFSPSFPPRAWFGVITFNIIAVGIIFYNLNYEYTFLRRIKYSMLILGTFAFVCSLYPAIKDVYALYNVTQKREVLVREAKEQNLPSCTFERYTPHTKFVHGEDPKAYEFMYGYYGIDIVFKEEYQN